eukprot:2901947-Alexandrium_andersonii.AAC.1
MLLLDMLEQARVGDMLGMRLLACIHVARATGGCMHCLPSGAAALHSMLTPRRVVDRLCCISAA